MLGFHCVVMAMHEQPTSINTTTQHKVKYKNVNLNKKRLDTVYSTSKNAAIGSVCLGETHFLLQVYVYYINNFDVETA